MVMTRQTPSKVTETTPTPSVPDADPSGLHAEDEAAHASEEQLSSRVQHEVDPDLRHRMINEAAYKLYAHRGCIDGFALTDWLQAEAEVDHLLSHRVTKG
jgi:hypothetical protein